MGIIKFLKLFGIALPVFFLIDMIWLGFLAKDLYREQIGGLMRRNTEGGLSPIWGAAIIFYLIFIAGIIFFVVHPSLDKESLKDVILTGAAFGFVGYATYDLTNLATLDGWPLKIVIIDMIWGSILSGSVATITYLIAKALGL